jgi:hypothetical protein
LGSPFDLFALEPLMGLESLVHEPHQSVQGIGRSVSGGALKVFAPPGGFVDKLLEIVHHG